MKFSLFAHAERYDDRSYSELYARLTALVQLAEQGGFDGFWVGEHYGVDFTAVSNPLVLLTHVAAQTSHIRLVAGTITAPFCHPVRLASEAALADVLSKGRVELALARGAYQFEFDRMAPGLSPTDGGAYMRELVPLLRQLWSGDASHDGLWSFPATTSIPKPGHPGGLPIWIAARETASHQFAISQGCNVCCAPLLEDDAAVEALVARFKQAVGSRPALARPKLMMLRHACVVESEREVDNAVEAVRGWYRYFARLVQNDGSTHNGRVSPVSVDKLSSNSAYDPGAIRRSALVGTPETVTARLRQYEKMGIDEVGLWTDFPGGHARKRRSVELLSSEVLPSFAG